MNYDMAIVLVAYTVYTITLYLPLHDIIALTTVVDLRVDPHGAKELPLWTPGPVLRSTDMIG